MLGGTFDVEHISSKIFMALSTFFFKQYACIIAPYVTAEGSRPSILLIHLLTLLEVVFSIYIPWLHVKEKYTAL